MTGQPKADPRTAEVEKRLAAEAAASLVETGMKVGLGTGSTVAYLLPALAARQLDIVCVATSARTEERARALGLEVVSFSGAGEGIGHLDIAIDGSDQVATNFWLVKGGGGAHTREKIVASAADRFVVIASSDKLVETLAPPVPLELMAFGLSATLRLVEKMGECRLRDVPASPDGGLIADYLGPVGDPAELCEHLAGTPGIVGHGLFPPGMVGDVLVGQSSTTSVVGSRPPRA